LQAINQGENGDDFTAHVFDGVNSFKHRLASSDSILYNSHAICTIRERTFNKFPATM